MRADLVEQALQMAITLRGELPAQVVFHADYAEPCVKPRTVGSPLLAGLPD